MEKQNLAGPHKPGVVGAIPAAATNAPHKVPHKVHQLHLTLKIRVDVVEFNGSHHATCPQLGCVFASGEDEDEALREAYAAIESYFGATLGKADPAAAEKFCHSYYRAQL